MSSPKPEVDDILSSIRKMIDNRGPAQVAAPPPRPPALLLSADNLVSLPPKRPDTPSPEDAAATARPDSPSDAADAPDADMESVPFFGAGRATWVHRPQEVPSIDQEEEEEEDTSDLTADAGFDWSDDTPHEDLTPPVEDTPETGADSEAPEAALSRIAAAAQRAVARMAADREESTAEPPVEDNLFALVTQDLPAEIAEHTRSGASDDDALAERLADVVREQIAETLESQIKALAPRLLDEDILRPVVADLIRKELAGAFGARITQGVRKLVRQEVHRAINLRRLE